LPGIGRAGSRQEKGFVHRAGSRVVREETKETFATLSKTLLFVLGFILFVVGLLDLVVGGASLRALVALLLGALLAGTPLALAYRDAVRAARAGKRS
jgi:uncharacterized membrane-anchored protein